MSLAEIAAELRGLAQWDPEAAHNRADALLIETIRVLGTSPSYYTDREVEAVVAAYEAVPKWFA